MPSNLSANGFIVARIIGDTIVALLKAASDMKIQCFNHVDHEPAITLVIHIQDFHLVIYHPWSGASVACLFSPFEPKVSQPYPAMPHYILSEL